MEYISLGSNCSITYQLDKLGLRKHAFPFDWAKISLPQLLEILTTDFDDFVESLELVKISTSHPIIIYDSNNSIDSNELSSKSSGSYILTNKYKIKYAHELEEKYKLDELKNNISKRINRFKFLGDKNIIFVRIELKPLNQSWYSNIIKLNNLLYKYSNNFKIILIICSDLEFNFPSNIIIYHYDKFVPDWKMDFIDWVNIFNK
jgi:hypothetical protein